MPRLSEHMQAAAEHMADDAHKSNNAALLDHRASMLDFARHVEEMEAALSAVLAGKGNDDACEAALTYTVYGDAKLTDALTFRVEEFAEGEWRPLSHQPRTESAARRWCVRGVKGYRKPRRYFVTGRGDQAALVEEFGGEWRWDAESFDAVPVEPS
jgi:hypothetical protein